MKTVDTDEKVQLLSQVQSLAEEWGIENVLIAVPYSWQPLAVHFPEDQLARFAFVTENAITVSAFHSGTRQVHREWDSSVIVME